MRNAIIHYLRHHLSQGDVPMLELKKAALAWFGKGGASTVERAVRELNLKKYRAPLPDGTVVWWWQLRS